MTTTSNCSLPSATSKTATENEVLTHIAAFIKTRAENLATAKAHKAEEDWLRDAIEDGRLEPWYDELSEEYDCPGVRWVRSETRRWSKKSYGKELQETIKAYEDANECPVSISWKARLK